ncbi:MAG: recombination regulator RecX [Lachnospiraceae bacterium]|nr:recombination regulator RecX [Lachnospiraceae bacterium]
MLILEIRKLTGRSKRSVIHFEDGEDIVLYSSEVHSLGLFEGDDLPKEEYDRILEEILLPRAKKRVLHLLEKQDRTRENLLHKLSEGGYPGNVAEEAVSYAEGFHYVDDERLARNYVAFHQDKKSRFRIKRDLMSKGVSSELADVVIDEEYTASEKDQIIGLLEKKNYDPKTASPKERNSVYRFLVSRGYKTSDVVSALGDNF